VELGGLWVMVFVWGGGGGRGKGWEVACPSSPFKTRSGPRTLWLSLLTSARHTRNEV